MKRLIESNLHSWKNEKKGRCPLILGGARQVGKSHLIEKNFANEFKNVISINFEKQPEYKQCFLQGYNIKNILQQISIISGKDIIPGESLLFFDEVQLCEEAITSLRYFYEDFQELHVIAAGSLLEFALEKISIPVGRVTYRQLYPLCFEEFLINTDNQKLLTAIQEQAVDKAFPEILHQKALSLLNEYMVLGGMPKVLATYIESRDLKKCQEIQTDLLESYRNDFAKYSRKNSELINLENIFGAVPEIICSLFKYTKISSEIQAKYLRNSLELLIKAGIVSPIYRTTGFPLGALLNRQNFKLAFIDVGLFQRACKLQLAEWLQNKTEIINAGQVAEQFVAQEILANGGYRKEELYYWDRNQPGSTAEVDYIIQKAEKIIAVEVKAGSTGRLKSLHLFLKTYLDSTYGLKVSLDNFSEFGAIKSVPLYAFGAWLKK